MADRSRPIAVVTGASGFIASHVVQQLLTSGTCTVRGTVLNSEEADRARSTFPEVDVFEADLNRDDGWKEAIAGSTFVLHLACPFGRDQQPFNEEDVIRPSVDGAQRVLQACVDSGTVKRVVFTSGLASISGGLGEHKRTYTEADSTDPVTLGPNEKAKALAERAVWDFMENLEESKRFEIVVLNPSMVIGPLLIGPPPPSMQFFLNLLEKCVRGCPQLCLALVDVRDVAKAHLAAMTSPTASGNRYIVYSESVWLKDIANVIKDEFKAQGYDIPTGSVPNFMVRMASLRNATARTFLADLGKQPNFNTTKMREELGVVPSMKLMDSIIDTCYSLIEKGFAVRKPGYRPRDEGHQ